MSGSENRKVIKNTGVLYVRMIVTMLLGVWTSRIVLNALGFVDQGLYNVVGGFVGLLSLLTNSLSSSISRFITFEAGRENKERIKEVYQNSSTVQLILAGVVILFAETLGLWLLSKKLVIPPDRMYAVHVVYQMSVMTFVVNLLSVTQNAMIIAHERMSFYAYVSIFNAVGSLGIALLIANSDLDRLILYAVLQCVISLCVRGMYTIYVRRNFSYCTFGLKISKEFFGPIFKFSGWNFIGSSSQILRVSGTSVLLNIFGGPIANTINGIANSVNNLATLFVNDFTTAYNPQITKRYAAGNYADVAVFVSTCSKYSFFLLAVIALPVIINIEPLLILWLKDIPQGTTIFARLIIVYSLIECLSKPLITAKNATGRIRNYQLVVGGITLLTIPISYVFLKLGLPIWTTYVSMILTAMASYIARMVMLDGDIPTWTSWSYLRRTLPRCISVIALGYPPLYLLYLQTRPTGWYVLLSCAIGVVWCVATCFLVGCNSSERAFAVKALSNLRNKLLK